VRVKLHRTARVRERERATHGLGPVVRTSLYSAAVGLPGAPTSEAEAETVTVSKRGGFDECVSPCVRGDDDR
jgi:hypothetical protein